MNNTINWMYFRKSCTTCKKAHGFLGTIHTDIKETVDANKTRIAEAAAVKLLSGIDKLIVAKGKKLAVFDLKNDRPDNETLVAQLMGPTGNLRAPTSRVGKTLLVGFNEEAYKEVLTGEK